MSKVFMTDGFILIAVLVLGSLGGWYFLLSKYYALRSEVEGKKKATAGLSANSPGNAKQESSASLAEPKTPRFDSSMIDGNHIPGMGLPPTIPFTLPESVLEAMRGISGNAPASKATTEVNNMKDDSDVSPVVSKDKQYICNLATIIHLSGLVLLSGIPFLNAVVPAVLWLLWRERHPFLNKHGILVVNWQLNLAIFQMSSLLFGAIFIVIFPELVSSFLSWSKTFRLVFTSGMFLPFNIFSAPVGIYGCIVTMRGAKAGYRGLGINFPQLWKFIALPNKEMSSNKAVKREPFVEPVMAKESVANIPSNIPNIPKGFGFS